MTLLYFLFAGLNFFAVLIIFSPYKSVRKCLKLEIRIKGFFKCETAVRSIAILDISQKFHFLVW